MNFNPADIEAPYGPWNPGIESPVPDHLAHLCTIFRPENSFTPLAQARELHALTGLSTAELVAFRPERLTLHELLIRVTANISVPDGRKIEDLGINFRRITADILASHIAPRADTIAKAYAARRDAIARFISAQSAALDPDGTALTAWEEKSHRSGGDPVERVACRVLARVVSALLIRHGRVWGSREMIAAVATGIAANEACGDEIGRLIDPWVVEAARAQGHRLLPAQAKPVVMNTKGASASGKSTLRPLQRGLAGALGVDWAEFALISPDIWRKQLLDYATLTEAPKYGGAFTGDELQMIDQKLDRYMAAKGERGEMSHLLIDRFRFDSFAADSDEAGSNLLTRFGQTVYLFFMITPPASLVERAWNRGLDVGRFKAVDDTLAHGVEAYSGMPQLFFTWVKRREKRVHFEFLDNSVRLGERPRTVAFGWNEVLNVLDVGKLLDVERYRRVNVDARSPDALYRDRSQLEPAKNVEFLRQMLKQFREVNFADRDSGLIYLRVNSGSPAWVDRAGLERAMADADTAAGLRCAVPDAFAPTVPSPQQATHLSAQERTHTLGSWATR